jgi:hypothetical protein
MFRYYSDDSDIDNDYRGTAKKKTPKRKRCPTGCMKKSPPKIKTSKTKKPKKKSTTKKSSTKKSSKKSKKSGAKKGKKSK